MTKAQGTIEDPEFQTVVDVIIQVKPEIGSVVWAPLKLVLIILERRGHGFEKLAVQLNSLVDALPRYSIYSQYFRDSTILQRALGNVYVAYIEFCLRAARYWETDGLVNFFKSASRSFSRQFDDIFSSIDRYRYEVEKTVAAVSLLYVRDVKQVTTELQEVGISQRKIYDHEKTLKWLSPLDFERDKTIFARQWVPGTSGWILQTPDYLGWVSDRKEGNRGPSLIWVRGGLGSGKTFLARFIIDSLAARNTPVLEYFFNVKQGQSSGRSSLSFVRTILYQLISRPELDTSATLEALHGFRAMSGKGEAKSEEPLWNELFKCI
ncbi:hypothetical protein B0T25DRAFT_576435 [Lasiosphaeria hispida]|uniref:NACHT domain-containing protein n=1 Tax=Lasiosphaeria hispida TaxID=260671 RepID=A0AAJ0HW44_9PEZI|nr:hypothetical protein B0T25DRAFT_576435 [Lasiosphaeria hispida]